VSVGDRPVTRDHERTGPLGHIAFGLSGQRAMPRGPDEALHELRPNVFLGSSALESHRMVGLARRVTQAVERDAPLAAEVEGRLGSVLEDRDHVRARRPELVVVLAQLDELLAAERSAEVAH
jgi:hypothetical protein